MNRGAWPFAMWSCLKPWQYVYKRLYHLFSVALRLHRDRPQGAQKVHLNFHTAPELWRHCVGWVLLYVHRNHMLIRDGSPGRPPRLSHSSWRHCVDRVSFKYDCIRVSEAETVGLSVQRLCSTCEALPPRPTLVPCTHHLESWATTNDIFLIVGIDGLPRQNVHLGHI